MTDADLLEKILHRTHPKPESLSAYRDLVGVAIEKKWSAGRVLPGVDRKSRLLAIESKVFPVGPVLMVACSPMQMAQFGLCDFAAGTYAGNPLHVLGHLGAIARGELKPAMRPSFEHEVTHVLQAMEAAPREDGWVQTDEAVEILLDRFREEFDAYFVEMAFHPEAFHECQTGLAAISPIPLTLTRTSLWRSYINTLEDMNSAIVMPPGLIVEVFRNILRSFPDEASKWGVPEEDIVWWTCLDHAHMANVAWGVTEKTRTMMQLHFGQFPFG